MGRNFLVGKAGAVNWTVGKLLNIVLLVIVLVLVIFAIGPNGFGPMKENIGMRMDSVNLLIGEYMAFFGFGSEDVYGNCYDVKISELSGGKDFLKGVGEVEGDFRICRDNVCEMNVSGGYYRIFDGEVQRRIGDAWILADYKFDDDIILQKEDWERYNAGVKFLRDAGAQDIYNSFFTSKFVLFGEADRNHNNVTAVWQSGEWVLQENQKEARYFSDDKEAIYAFSDFVTGGFWGNDEDVYWAIVDFQGKGKSSFGNGENFELIPDYFCKDACESKYFETDYSYKEDRFEADECSGADRWRRGKLFCCCSKKDFGFDYFEANANSWSSIGDLIVGIEDASDMQGFRESLKNIRNSEIDNGKEADLLIERFGSDIAPSLMKKVEISELDMQTLRDSLNGKKIVVAGEEFVAMVDKGGEGFPYVIFDGRENDFSLEFWPFARDKSDLFKGVDIDNFPAYLAYRENGVFVRGGNEEVYRLPEGVVDEVFEANLSFKFLRKKCK